MKIYKYPKSFGLVLTLVFSVFAISSVSAIWGSNGIDTGFFTNKNTGAANYDHVLPNATDTTKPGLESILGPTLTKQTFIDFIKLKLGSASSWNGSTQDQVGAAFIIQTMRGDKGWPGAADIRDWENRINNDDIYMYTAVFAEPSGHNSGYSASASVKDVAWINQPITTKNLVFASRSTKNLYSIKTNCGNVILSDPLPVGSPIISGSKQDETGAMNGPFAGDRITVSGVTTVANSSVGNPFSLKSDAELVTVSAANTAPGWQVVGHGYNVTCNTATLTSTCNASPPPITSSVSTSFNITAKTGYIYNVVWVYRQVSTSLKITKVDTSGKNINDVVRVYPSSSTVLSSSQNPLNYSVPSGITSIDIDTAAGYTVSSYVINNVQCLPELKAAPLTCSPINNPNNVGATFNQTLAPGYSYDVTINFTSGDKLDCLYSNITTPFAVAVQLTDKTPNPQSAPSAITSPNINTTSYSKQNKTVVTNVNDISIGGTSVLTLKNLLSQSYQQAIVDYKPFVVNYPYDSNQASVTYDSYYTTNNWKSSPTVSYYTYAYDCPTITGSTLVSAQYGNPSCTYSTPDKMSTYPAKYNTINATPSYSTSYINATPNSSTSYINATPNSSTSYIYATPKTITYSCYTVNSKGRLVLGKCSYNTYSCPSGYNGPDSFNLCSKVTTTYSCPSGYTGPNGSNLCSKVTTTYSCPSGYTGPNGSNQCTSTTPTCNGSDQLIGTTCYPVQTYTQFTKAANSTATAWYSFILQSSVVDQKASSNASAQNMTQCFYRKFTVNSIDSTNSTVTFNDNENPTSVTAAGYTVSTTFSYEPASLPNKALGLRLPMKANLSYNYKLFDNGCSGSNAFVVSGGSGPGPALPNPTSITPGATCGVSLPPLAPGDVMYANYSMSILSGLVDNVGVIKFAIPGTVSSGDKRSAPVVNKPYFKVFGSDISVGGGFYATVNGNKTCTSTISSIFGWNSGTNSVYTNRYSGAGAQFLLSSTGSLKGAASNQNNPNASPWPAFTNGSPKSDPIGFSFANTGTNSAANNYGTSLGAANCIPDYYSSLPTSPTPSSLGNNSSLSGNSSIYTMPGGSTIKSSNIGPRDRVTVYVNGDLYIDGDINFVGSYSTINDIPSLIVIVKDGNIYIKNTVANLSGIFIAQSTISNKGYIYDCALDFLPIANNQLFDSCVTQLTVNGSFIANKVVLNRTGPANKKTTSSLRGAVTNETNTNSNATEIFNYGPAFWMNTALPITTSAGTTSAGYDSIINLPPVL